MHTPTPISWPSPLRLLGAGLLQGVLVILSSVFFNAWLFGAYNEAITVGRATDGWHMRALLPATTLAWGVGLAVAFVVLGRAIPGSPTRRGAVFGVLIWGCVVACLEVFNYALYDFPLMAIVAGLLCYLVALTSGGVVMAHILDARA